MLKMQNSHKNMHHIQYTVKYMKFYVTDLYHVSISHYYSSLTRVIY